MKKPVIVADCAIPFLRGRLEPYADVRYLPGSDISPEVIADADSLIIRTRTRCDETLLSDTPVRAIATATIGTDHIDLEYCKTHDITVANATGCNAPGVAQWVWSAILSQGYDPNTTTVGIIGVGHVGSLVAEWGRGLGFQMLLNDPPRSDAEGFVSTPLDEILTQSDIVTIHTPLTLRGAYPSFHLIDADRIAQMRPGTLILNAARGGIIDEHALIPYLNRGSLSAIIDTWENEPNINPELLNETLLATPHIAGYSLEGKQRATRMAVEATAHALRIPLPDLSDLAPAYDRLPPSAEQILESYSPVADALPLYQNPDDFESLRANYNYRPEP